MKPSRFLAVLAAVGSVLTSSAYVDDFFTVSDNTVAVTDLGDDIVYVFTGTGSSFTLTANKDLSVREILVVGGGGAGGNVMGGGGGGGQVLHYTTLTGVATGGACTVAVGAGGTLGGGMLNGNNGGTSSFTFPDATQLKAFGGGGGGCFSSNPPTAAAVTGEIGSGGGNGYGGSTTPVLGTHYQFGNPGGGAQGGGGGAGLAGENAGLHQEDVLYGEETTYRKQAGYGGEGVAKSITGTAQVYGSGGGGGGGQNYWSQINAPGGTNAGSGGTRTDKSGGGLYPHHNALPATDGFGGGGGGGSLSQTGGGGIGTASKGGSGTVIVRISKNDISQYLFKCAPIDDQYYTGAELRPSVTVTRNRDGGTVSVADYTVAYTNNSHAGTATITVTGINDYEGVSASVDFTIKPAFADDCIRSFNPFVRSYSNGIGRIYVFTNLSEETTLEIKQQVTVEKILVAGGGGGGGCGVAGGGGGGGVVYDETLRLVNAGAVSSVILGAGGAGGLNNGYTPGENGGHTRLVLGALSLGAYGGGGGGTCNYAPGEAAVSGEIGSGGGGGQDHNISYIDGTHYNSTQGNAGGYSANGVPPSGGGGAGGAGSNGAGSYGGTGGAGRALAITGTSAVYGSGGGTGGGNGYMYGGAGGVNAGAGIAQNGTAKGGNGGDGFGGGGGGGSLTSPSGGRGGVGTVVLVLKTGDRVTNRFEILPIADQYYTASAIEPETVVSNPVSNAVLVRGTDYELAFSDNTAVGTATVTVAGKAGTVYEGFILLLTFEIKTPYFAFAPIGDQMFFDQAVTPAVTVTNIHDGAELVQDLDYTLAFTGNTAPGTATATATGKAGTRYAGLSAQATFAIKATWYDDYIATSDMSVRTNLVDGHLVYIFTNTASTATITLRQTMTLKDALVVGGGGAGGTVVGGGGGGGGVVTLAVDRVAIEGHRMTVKVGAGGASSGTWDQALHGSPSTFTHESFALTAYGGAGGGGANCSVFASGNFGSCGGAGNGKNVTMTDGLHYTSAQGNRGGKQCGGGGGAGQPGGDYNSTVGGVGGEGVTNSITGAAEVYGSGGGSGGSAHNGYPMHGRGGTHGGAGSVSASRIRGGAGDDTFGAGGGGGCYGQDAQGFAPSNGGPGGSGIVVLSFAVGGEIGQPEIASAALSFPNGCTQPKATVALGATDPDMLYSARVEVSMGIEEGVYIFNKTFLDVINGGSVELLSDFSPATGTTVYLQVSVYADGAQARSTNLTAVAVGTQSPYYGKGGGAGIIHVRPGAIGKGDGSDWFHAYTDFRSAIKELSAERHELWFVGDEYVQVANASINPSASAAIRGGFTGLETKASDRVKGAFSTIEGSGSFTSLTFANTVAVTLDGFRMKKGGRCLSKSGAGDLTITNCIMEKISSTSSGVGANVTGSGAEVRFVDCRFSEFYGSGTASTMTSGGAVSVSSLKRAFFDNCTFMSNGVALATGPGNSAYSMSGSALYSSGAPVTMRNCLIKGCRGQSLLGGGGVVRLNDACGGSAFSNCVFTANVAHHGFGNYTSFTPSSCAGLLVLSLSARTTPVDIVNCTFAYSLVEDRAAPAGVTVVTGTANVKNSIFFGNVMNPLNATGRDIHARANGVVNVDYSLFAENSTNCFSHAEGGEVNIGAGVIYGDPLLAAPASEFEQFVNRGTWYGFKSAMVVQLLNWADVHLRSRAGYIDENGNRVWFRGDASPALDAGDPKSDYSNEPEINGVAGNGKRVNLGAYGNTPYATMTSWKGTFLILR